MPFSAGEIIAGTYRLERVLGAGGMGIVFLATDIARGEQVAIKMLHAETALRGDLVERMIREASAARRIESDHVVRVLDIASRDDGAPYLVMEYLEGCDLAALLAAQGRLSVGAAAAYLVQACDAIGNAHSVGIVHRDLKPANLFVCAGAKGEACVKVLDFGISKQTTAEDGRAPAVLTQTSGIVGTPIYMSPEQLASSRDVDARADIWSLGVILYELLTGRHPFAASTLPQLCQLILQEPVPPLSATSPDMPAELDALLAKCLAKRREERFQDVAALVVALQPFADAHPQAPRAMPALSITQVGTPASVPSSPSPSGRAQRSSVAVLPLVDLSASHDRQYVCEGISEGIMSALARVPGLGVVARTSAFRLAERDAREIGVALGVASVVEGTLRDVAGGLRVTVRVIDTTTGYQTWSDTFDRPLADLASIEDDVAAAVASTLHLAMPVETKPRRRIEPKAIELYMQGRYLWNRRPGEVVWQAKERFEEAVAIDPSFAEAWAGLGDVFATLGSWESGVLPHGDAQRTARSYAERALSLSSELVEARTTLAYTLLHFDWDIKRADSAFRGAIALSPKYAAAHHWYSHCLAAAGRFSASLVESQLALATDPMNLILNVHLAWHFHMARDPERVLEQSERVLAMDGKFHWAHYFAGWGAEGLGASDRAVDEHREALACSNDDTVMLAGLARAYASAGDRPLALTKVNELSRRGEKGQFAYETALVHLALGDVETALDDLSQSLATRSGWMVYADVDPRLDPLRGEARFGEILASRAAG